MSRSGVALDRAWNPREGAGGRVRDLAAGIAPLLGVVLIWELVVRIGWVDKRIIPSITTIAHGMIALLADGSLQAHTAATVYRLLVGFMLGAVPGTVFGLVIGLTKALRTVVDPIVAALYPIPKIAVFPLIMFFLGIGDASKIVVVAIGTFFITLINARTGVLNIPTIYLDVARVYNASFTKLFKRVIFPAALPIVFGGLRVALGNAIILMVAVEFTGAVGGGVGRLIWQSWEVLNIRDMFVGLFVVTVLGLVLTAVLGKFEALVIRWKE